MKSWIARAGYLLFAVFCLTGLVAWVAMPGRVTLVLRSGEETTQRDREAPGISLDVLLEEIEGAEQRTDGRLQALEDSLATAFSGLEAPFQAVLDAEEETASEARRELASVRRDLAKLQSLQQGQQNLPAMDPAAALTGAQPDLASNDLPAAAELPEENDASTAGVQAPISFTELFRRSEQRTVVSSRAHFQLVEGGCKVGFDGTSNLHDFSGSTMAVIGTIEFDPDHPERDPGATVRADARMLDTGDEGRDEEMHENKLESGRFSELAFRLDSIKQVRHETDRTFTAVAGGVFTCHGVERPVQIPVRVERLGSRILRISGEWKVQMSEHDIDAPTAIGGLITVDDEVTAWFTLQARALR